MTAGTPRRRLREISLSLLVAATAVLVIARTATADGLAFAHTSLALVGHDETRLLAPAVPSQDVDDAAARDGLVLPVRTYRITARFGDHGDHWHLRHTGLDFKAPWGAPVYAVQDATVVKLAWHPAYGRMIILQVAPGVTLWYCHLSAVLTKRGPVKAGAMIGRVGQSGNATGPHLHLEVRVWDRPTDPFLYLFGTRPGKPGGTPRWYPATPSPTVATLARLPGT